MIVLQRFLVRDGMIRKNRQLVSNPLANLSISGKDCQLKAVVVHKGSQSAGHYTALTNYGGSWFHCDDSQVTAVSSSKVSTEAGSGYIFMYSCKESS